MVKNKKRLKLIQESKELAAKFNLYFFSPGIKNPEVCELLTNEWDIIISGDIFTIKAYLDRYWKLKAFF